MFSIEQNRNKTVFSDSFLVIDNLSQPWTYCMDWKVLYCISNPFCFGRL